MPISLGDVKKNKLKIDPIEDEQPIKVSHSSIKKSSNTTFNSNSIVAKKKNDINNINLPIAKNAGKFNSSLPTIPMNRKDAPNPTFTENFKNNALKVPKTILAGANYVGQGSLKALENAGDTAMQLATTKVNPYYWAHPEKLKEHQDIVKDIVSKDAVREEINWLAKDDDFNKNFLDKNSLIKEDNLGGKVAKAVGNMLPSIALAPLASSTKLGEAASLGSMAFNSYGSGTEEAYKNGATFDEAQQYGLFNAAIETATEKLFSGIGGVYGHGPIDDAIKNRLSKRVSSAIGKRLVDLGVDMAGEGTEEVIGDLLQPLAQKLTYAKDADLMKLYKDQNYLEDFVAGSLSTVVLRGMTGKKDIKVNEDNVISDDNLKNAKKTSNLNDLDKKSINDSANTQITENDINNRQISSDLNSRITQMREEEQNSSLNDQITSMREQDLQKQQINSQNQLTSQVNQIENKVDKLSDNSATFAQDNKIISNKSNIQGLESYSKEDVKDIVNNYIKETLLENNIDPNDVKIVNSDLHGSRLRGMANNNSDLDVVVQYDGDLREDDLFNILNDNNLEIEGIKVDINPIKDDLSTYMDKSNIYDLKQKQFNIISKTNPMKDDYHTGIRSTDDIKTLEETLNDSDYEGYDEFNPDLTRQDIENALKNGTITVYSSYPIENGVFVSPSKMEAESYSSNGKVYSKEVPIQDVAWIDPTQGQYVAISSNNLANNLNDDYNINKGDVNESIRGNDRQGLEGLSQREKSSRQNNDASLQQREYTAREFNTFEEQARRNKKESYTNKEKQIASKIKRQYNKDIVFFDGNLAYNGGADTKNSNIIYVSDRYSDDGKAFASYHEVMESNIYHNKQLANEYIKPVINDIVNSTSFKDAKTSFSLGETLEGVSDYLIAKDLYCDIFASNKSNVSLPYDNKLSNDIIEEINYSIEKFDDKLLKLSKKINVPDSDYYKHKIEELREIDYESLDTEGKKLYNEQMDKYIGKLARDPRKESSYDMPKIPTRKEVQRRYAEETEINKIDFDSAKQMKKIVMNRNTAIRLNEKIFGKEIGGKINDKFFYPIKESESNRIRFLNQERNDIRKLGIKPRSKESAAVQKWGEKKFVNEYGELVPYSENMLMNDVPDDVMREKVKTAAHIIRNKYDHYLELINEKLTENGYDPIPARDDYFMHFEELTDLFSRIGVPTKINDLPTDINGVTDQFRPGKQFFINAMHREGIKTTYDAITGVDRYLENASNLIYHTENIQRLRVLEKYIRDNYGREHGLDEYVDLTPDELNQVKDEYKKRIDKINSNHLSEYASWLQEYTNVLAGKKSMVDRSIESFFGRKIYKYLQFGKKQVGSNMTGFNIGSALTNFISGTQGMAKTNKVAFMRGTLDTVKNIFVNDGFINKSDFLTTRFGSDKISKTTWEKLSNAGQVFMGATDYFTANQIVRSKYYEYKQKGYSDSEAIKKADRFADKLMAGRGKGDMPNIFNSQMLGIITQFQLEVNNQLDGMFYDTFTEDYAKDSKSKLSQKSPGLYNTLGATFTLGQLFAFAYLFNNEYEKIVGRRPAFDVIDMILDAFKDLNSDDDEENKFRKAASNLFDKMVDNLPFVSTFTGGRIPLSSAVPNVPDLIKGDSSLPKELSKPLYYLFPPTGGGQVKKTVEGLSMFSKDKDIKGSYTDSGRLRFPVEDTTANKVQAALFGQYANKNARDYFEGGYTPLTENAQKAYKKANVPIAEYWKHKKEYNYAYKNDKRYTTISAITDYDSYVEYNKAIKNIQEKYKKSSSDVRKNHVFEYIDGLRLNEMEKTMMKKLYYSYSYKDADIVSYLKKEGFTKNERKQIYKTLKMSGD